MMGSSRSNDEYEITGINVTPLVDIMLVLLIIFLVTATYIVKEAIKVDLPQAANAGETTARTFQLVITREGRTYLDGVEASDEALVQKVQQSPGRKEDWQAVIAADRDARHGTVVHVLDLLRSEGVAKFAIEIEKAPK